jgi:superfamily II RNA helicase
VGTNPTLNEIFATKYPYELSDFQKYAIEAIYTGNHVLVTAHTGSGKTLPAEFAISFFVGKGKKVIYTSPIKALSNQKYYEFSQKYPEITFGLFTGDIKTNPEADVLIMTTEILMNALFHMDMDMDKNTDTDNTQFRININTELAAVVFDEVHYINDVDRGQTWEKTLLMLPKHIQKIMLSATMDSPEKFAKWVEGNEVADQGESEVADDNQCEKTKKEVYLCSTNHRVVPLTHYIYMTISEAMLKTIKDKTQQKEMRDLTKDIITIQTDKGIFQENGYKQTKKITEFLEKKPMLKRKYILNDLMTYLKNREMLPAIAFVFSRKNVELCAEEITIPLLEDDSKVPYIVKRECDQIIRKLPNYEEYLRLPEYNSLVSLLEKGVGIHHSGMIPILREIVELMISKKYIKLLFATESFAIGLDCPIKTAIFTGLTKFDGKEQRWLLSHEYTQMAGRAGRRGIDTIGHVIHCNNLFTLPTMTEYRDILCGKPQTFVSKFRISYNWVLNLLVSDENENKKEGKKENILKMTEKSMIYEELQQNINYQKTLMMNLEQEISQKKKNLELLKTPIDICLKYMDAENCSKTAVNKKKKELQREIERMELEYRDIPKDVVKVREWNRLQIIYENKEVPHLEYLETYIETQIEKVLVVLAREGFVSISDSDNDSDNDILTKYGKYATKISEIHPLIWCKFISSSNYLSEFSTKQIVGILSCITNIKVSSEYRLSVAKTSDSYLRDRILELQTEYKRYEDMENMEEMRTGISYEEALMFDIIDESMEWCDCVSEEECKWFIQTKLSEKEISVGDFAKAMMKISTVAKELSTTFIENTELVFKLSTVDELVLKYIATSQSLYV